jgi:hypothetical protein
MQDFFRVFDDSIPNPPRMNSQIWFYRPTKSLCPECNGPYLLHEDRQRFCDSCMSWFHVKCLHGFSEDNDDDSVDYMVPNVQRPLDIDTLNNEGFPAIMDGVLENPTVRGHGGHYDFDNNWLNTGSGVQKGLIKDWYKEDSYPHEWLEELGENFLQDFVIEKSWKFYGCPLCGLRV